MWNNEDALKILSMPSIHIYAMWTPNLPFKLQNIWMMVHGQWIIIYVMQGLHFKTQ